MVIDRGSAQDGDLAIGTRTVVRVPEPVEVTVVGIATFGSLDSLGGVTFAAFETETAQELVLPASDALTGVVVSADAGISQSELVDRLQPLLPEGVEAITGETLTAEQEADIESDFLGFFESFLLVFAGIALVVATFSIYNTFSIVVAQRTRESALLRALGASRRQVLGWVIAETLVIGLLASALGVVAGIGLSRGLAGLFGSLGFDLPTSELVIQPASVIASVAVGLVVTLLAAMAPAVRASRVRPMAALRDVAVDRSSTSVRRAVMGTVVAGAGAGLTVWGAAAGDLATTGIGALLLIVGVVTFGPVVARPMSALLGAPLGRFRGVSGSLARANAMRNPIRTSGTASALMIGVAVVAMFTVVAASLRAYIHDTVDTSFQGDLVIETEGFSGAGFSPEMTTAIDELPEVETATGLGWALTRLDDADRLVTTVNGPQLARVLDIEPLQGSIDELTDGTLAVSTTFAEDNGWSLASSVPAAFSDGTERDLVVTAIYESSDIVGDVLLPDETLGLTGARQENGFVMVSLADGVRLDDGKAAVQSVADDFSAPAVQDGEELAESVAGEIDQILAIVYVLLALAIIIALMAIATTLSLSIHERTRELGLLRAVGQSRRQLRSMVRGESLIVALFGTAGGLGLGSFLGWALTRALGEQEGLAVPFDLPVTQLAIVFALGGLAGLLAATRPARRAAKLDVLGAIATGE